MTRRLVGMLFGSLRSEHAKDVEIAVLRHQPQSATDWRITVRTGGPLH